MNNLLVVLFQWYLCNSVRLLVIPMIYLSNSINLNDTTTEKLTFDAGYFTAGQLVDLISLIVCFLCLGYITLIHCIVFWKRLIPFFVYTLCDFLLSTYLAYRVFWGLYYYHYNIPLFGNVSADVYTVTVMFSMLFKFYHICLTLSLILIMKNMMKKNTGDDNNKRNLWMEYPPPPPHLFVDD